MTSTKKGKVWWRHGGACGDIDSDVMHTLREHAVSDEHAVFGDKGYVSGEREATLPVPGKIWVVMRKAPKGSRLHPLDERINRIIASLRAKVEHPFRVLKCQFGYRKTRYRGLTKNQAHLFSVFGLGNLFLIRRRLMP